MVLSAGVVIIRREPESCRFLLLRAYHYWDFPKGETEPGEDPLEAARRDVREETGIVDLLFPWGEVYHETPPYRSGNRHKVARYYIAETRQQEVVLGINPELGRAEHDEFRWVNFQQAQVLLGARLQQVLDWAGEISGCLETERPFPGPD